ncbi:hypothetical protein JCM10213_000739 [Rhodosporidiobolus nylandii]
MLPLRPSAFRAFPTASRARLFSTSVRLAYAHPQGIYKSDSQQNKQNMAGSRIDVYSEIVVDHNNVKDLYARYKAATSTEEKSTLVNTIIHELAMHSEAEEVSVYNVLEAKGLTKESDLLRKEHQELEEVLYSVDWTKVDSAELAPITLSSLLSPFSRRSDLLLSPAEFERAVELFIVHSSREEDEVLKDLESKISPEENDKLARDFLAVRKVVPTRPHPAAPQSGGVVHKVLGMATKPHDKILETLQGGKFAELKYQARFLPCLPVLPG